MSKGMPSPVSVISSMTTLLTVNSINGNRAALGHRFDGVLDQIQQSLLYLIAIEAYDRQIGS